MKFASTLLFIPVTMNGKRGWVQLASTSLWLENGTGTKITLSNGEDVEVEESLDSLIKLIRAEVKK